MTLRQNLIQTTEDRLQVGLGGGLLRQVNGDELALRDAADAAYVKGYALTPVPADPDETIATKEYVDDLVAGPQVSAIRSDAITANGVKTSSVSLALTAVVKAVRLQVNTLFDGTPTVTVADGNNSPLAAFTIAELGVVGLYEEAILQQVAAAGPITITTAGYGTQGSARVWIEYANSPASAT